MNWTRTILDGLAIAAYFNLFAAAVALYKQVAISLLSVRHHQGGGRTANKSRKSFLLALDLLWGVAPPLFYGAVSTVEGRTTGFWRLALTGYIQWMIVNLCDLLFLDLWLIQKKQSAVLSSQEPKGTQATSSQPG